MMEQELPYMNLSLKNISGEKWKELPELGEYYLISNYGRIKSLSRYYEVFIPKKGRSICYWSKERIRKIKVHQKLNSFVNKPYYECTIALAIEGIEKVFLIHRLVYSAFHEKIDFNRDKLVVTHKDGNGLNNHFENLLATYKSNVLKKSYLNKRHVSPFALKSKSEYAKIASKAAKTRMKPIIQQTIEGKDIRSFDSIKEAALYSGIHVPNIVEVLKNRRKHAAGFLWKYLNETEMEEIAQ